MATRTTGRADGRDALNDPGQKPSGAGPADRGDLQTLSPAECIGLLEPGGVGRVGFASAEGVVILPVNFAVAEKAVVFRTAPDGLLAAHAHGPASFQTDHLDEASREGWSVLVQGHVREITDEREVRRLERGARLDPWAGGARDVWLRILPVRISGRRVQRAGEASPGTAP